MEFLNWNVAVCTYVYLYKMPFREEKKCISELLIKKKCSCEYVRTYVRMFARYMYGIIWNVVAGLSRTRVAIVDGLDFLMAVYKSVGKILSLLLMKKYGEIVLQLLLQFGRKHMSIYVKM